MVLESPACEEECPTLRTNVRRVRAGVAVVVETGTGRVWYRKTFKEQQTTSTSKTQHVAELPSHQQLADDFKLRWRKPFRKYIRSLLSRLDIFDNNSFLDSNV